MDLEPSVWGPHYWFFLHSLTFTYPKKPNTTTKKKYYDFVQNLPLFIPHKEIAKRFINYLDAYPLTPYLDSSESFQKWMLFIHNKINKSIGKKQITYYELLNNFNEIYKPKQIVANEYFKWREKLIYITLILLFIGIIAYIYNK